jgi:predicted secreted protein
MKKMIAIFAVTLTALSAQSALAQQTKGTVVSVSGTGEVVAENDQAKATFFIEEQDKDKAAAASRVNQKMKEGTELIKKLDPDGKLATRGYYTYPVYPDQTSSSKPRNIIGWRVGQYLDLTTKNILQLPAAVAAVQQTLALNGLNFSLAEETVKNLEAKRVNAAYKNLGERVQLIAKAMGRDVADSALESLDFVGSDNHFAPQPRMFAAAAPMMKGSAVQETSFEPGETILTTTIVAKIKFN